MGDTTQAVYNQYWARQKELVTLNTKFSALLPAGDKEGKGRNKQMPVKGEKLGANWVDLRTS